MKLILLSLVYLLVLACSSEHERAGGSDHPNEIVGLIEPGVVVRLHPIDTKAPTLAKAAVISLAKERLIENDTCNSKGEFRFSNVETGYWRIEAFTPDSTELLLSPVFYLGEKDSLDLELLELKPAAFIHLLLPSGENIRCDSNLALAGTPWLPHQADDAQCHFPFVVSEEIFALIQTSSPADSLALIQASEDLQVLRSTGLEVCLLHAPCDSGQVGVTITKDSLECLEQWSCNLSASSWEAYHEDSVDLFELEPHSILDSTDEGDTISLHVGDVVEIMLPVDSGGSLPWIGPVGETASLASSSSYSAENDVPYLQYIRIHVLSPQDQQLTWNREDGRKFQLFLSVEP